MKEIGRFMKEKRSDRGLSLREASRLSGVRTHILRDIEDGKSKNVLFWSIVMPKLNNS